jgi:tetratricopeptide (TPR) repeat protein
LRAGRAEVPVANIQSDKADSPARETAGSRLSAKRAAKAAQKASQRGNVNPAQEVAKSMQEVNAWIDNHGRKVWYVLGAGVVAAVAAIAITSYMETRNRGAGELLQTAVTTSEGLIIAPEETPPEDAIVPTFESVKVRDAKALQQFRAVDSKFPSSPAAHYALLGQANALLELAKYSDAASAYDKALASADDDVFLRFRALEGSGYALEGQQKYPQARERFEQLSKLNNGAYRSIGDYHRARMLVAEGKRDEARKLLEALSKAAADKPDEQGERFESVTAAASTLLTELGGEPAEKGPSAKGSGISQQVLDAVRKQLGSQKKK